MPAFITPNLYNNGSQWDLTVGSYGFFLAIDDQNPHIRQTNEYKRQQVDTSNEPGEQTLSAWWVRSQDTWHRGQGLLNYDPGTNRETQYRFASGFGINPWTQGQVTIGWDVSTVTTGAGDNFVALHRSAGSDYWYCVANSVATSSGTMTRRNAASSTTYTMPVGLFCHTEPTFAGTTVLVGSKGAILSGSDSGSALTSLWTLAASTDVITPYWVKGRIMATRGADMWELTTAGGAMGAATFTAPMAGGTWSAVAETPDVILAAYNAGGKGYVYALSLNTATTAGSSPTLGAFVQVAEMPPGEEITALRTYLGSFVALGTTNGVRIAKLASGGSMDIGPLTIKSTSPVYALNASSNYVWAAYDDGYTGINVARIDLGQEILNFQSTGFASQTLRYAYNIDQNITLGSSPVAKSIWPIGKEVRYTTDNNGYSVTTVSTPVDGAIVGVSGYGIYRETSNYASTVGRLYSGRIRYDTNEPKIYAYMNVRADLPTGTTIGVYMRTDNNPSTWISIATLTSGSSGSDIYLGTLITSAAIWAEVRFDFYSTDVTKTPTLYSWSVKATPRPFVQRKIVYPIRMADFESDANGVKTGYVGYAYDRLSLLEELESNLAMVQIWDKTSTESYVGVIQSVQFIRDTPPSKNVKNYGGRVNLTVLRVG